MILQKINRYLFGLFGEERFGEKDRPPGSTQFLKFCAHDDNDYQIATTDNNDGFELWLGSPHEWHVFYSAPDARRLAWFVLWEWWAKSTWFGLKRAIYYWLLRNEIKWLNASVEEKVNEIADSS